jgi:hypothetical protein
LECGHCRHHVEPECQRTRDIATIAAIEVKYDLLTALLMCDRMEELQLAVGQIAEEDLLLGVAQCKAQAAASSYVRLFARARDFN